MYHLKSKLIYSYKYANYYTKQTRTIADPLRFHFYWQPRPQVLTHQICVDWIELTLTLMGLTSSLMRSI